MMNAQVILNDEINELVLSFLCDLKILYRQRGFTFKIDHDRSLQILNAMFKHKINALECKNNGESGQSKISEVKEQIAKEYKSITRDDDESIMIKNLKMQQFSQRNSFTIKANQIQEKKECEYKLLFWLEKRLMEPRVLYQTEIRRKAREIWQKPNFKASNSWMETFLYNHPALHKIYLKHCKRYGANKI